MLVMPNPSSSFLRANVRRRKNFIPELTHEGATHITHEAKAVALDDFFTKELGTKPVREHTINSELLRPIRHDLDRAITEEEIH
jgi:hypothetical protein